MKQTPPLSPEARALLDQEREIQPLPATVRARAMARARAALVAGTATRRSAPTPARSTRWAAAAALLCLISGGVGVAAYQVRAHLTKTLHEQPAPPPVVKAPTPAPARPAQPIADVPALPETAVETPHLSRADAAREELRLLRQARAAVAREDYASALPQIAEHARRFKDGRLAEEREALRVKSLAGLGRTEEAQRAATAFRARFPRSVLLPAVSQMLAPRP
jgi:type IV secretory pathway VirB10-like protein